jgi:hypothetical protein
MRAGNGRKNIYQFCLNIVTVEDLTPEYVILEDFNFTLGRLYHR